MKSVLSQGGKVAVPLLDDDNVVVRAACASCVVTTSQGTAAYPTGAGPVPSRTSQWCRADCRPEKRAVRASPCHSGGSRPAAPPLPDISECRHRTDRARGGPSVVLAHLHVTAAPARRFFDRRSSVITRAFGSPKTPRTVGCGRKPGNQYASHSRRLRFAVRAIQN
jgi:hypothetical protein